MFANDILEKEVKSFDFNICKGTKQSHFLATDNEVNESL